MEALDSIVFWNPVLPRHCQALPHGLERVVSATSQTHLVSQRSKEGRSEDRRPGRLGLDRRALGRGAQRGDVGILFLQVPPAFQPVRFCPCRWTLNWSRSARRSLATRHHISSLARPLQTLARPFSPSSRTRFLSTLGLSRPIENGLCSASPHPSPSPNTHIRHRWIKRCDTPQLVRIRFARQLCRNKPRDAS